MESHEPRSPGPTPQESGSRVENHITVLGVLHVAVGTIALLTFAIAFFVVVGTGLWMWDEPDVAFGTGVAAFVLFVFGALSLPGLIGGIGLLLWRPWARILLLIVGFVQLVNIPFGTALGIYTIWVLLRDDVRLALVARPSTA
jgi:hypothetical protein